MTTGNNPTRATESTGALSNAAIDADLAALLDNEVAAIRTGIAPAAEAEPAPAAPPSAPSAGVQRTLDRSRRSTVGPAVVEVSVPEELIDVPPAASEARPAGVSLPDVMTPPAPLPVSAAPVPVLAAASVLTQPPEAERSLPTTKRFGAIILETGPAAAASAESAAQAAAAPETGFVVGEDGSMRSAGDAALQVRVAPPGPGTEVQPAPLPTLIDRTADQKAIVIDRLDQVLDQGWQKALHKQIDDLYRQVTTEFSSPPDKAEQVLGMLRESRQLLIDSPEEYVSAEFRTAQVRVMLDRMRESRKQSGFYGPRILAYQALWLLGMLLGLVFAGPLATLIGGEGRVTGPALLNVYPVINTMIWGGIGGIVGALYTLWWHISREQDFDRNYLMWYMVQPLMGVVLGGIIFLIMAGGFLILNVNLQAENASTGARLLPYLAAVLAGFRQNFIYEQFDRLIALFTPAERRESGGGG